MESLAAEGIAALKRGEPGAARELLTRLAQAGAADAAVWFAMAAAHRQLDHTADESRALDQALKTDPNYLPALIGKGDVFARLGDTRAASAHYGLALRLARALPSRPTEWGAELSRAAAARDRMLSDYEAHLMSLLSARGVGEAGTDRVKRAVGLLFGRREIFLQQPTNFYFPELPQVEFYDPRDFSWVKTLEMRASDIRAEVEAILDRTGWAPYIESDDRSPNANPLLLDPNWSAFYLIKDGKEVEANARRCPVTMAALRDLPLCRTGRTPAALFSLLRPGTRIRPHHGHTNARLICHLPLIIPEECALRVGNETRVWHEGEVVVFDDSMEHEAWNLSEESRVVLIFDVWRPELSEKERILVGAMLDAGEQFDRPALATTSAGQR